nr:sodium:proton antiporter [Chryseomicrobium excrementi]
MLDSLLVVLMVIIFLGIFSQWLAWRFRMPAIVIMSIVGLLVGPVFGLINPEASLGELFSPLISLAVAIILFEGSLNLDFREVKTFSKPLTHIVTLGAFIAWIAGSLAAHYLAGLSLEVAFIIGGLFIVTGPTVILPLLRQAKLKSRPAAILKWEGIVVDPFGALLAVFAYEFIKFAGGTITLEEFLLFFGASIFATLLGVGVGWGQGKMLERGMIPEYLKAPVLFAVVLLVFVVSDLVMHETGLLAVTAMGIMMANMHIASINDIRHFKENISVLLISTIFVMLTASLQAETLLAIFDWRIIVFVAAMLFVVRPLSIWVSTIGTDLHWKEKTLIGWIAPRGIVALTVSGYFAGVLTENGYQDADILTALTFALVFSTVVFHGFSIGWLAKKLDLAASDRPGVLIVGGTEFSAKLGESLKNDGVETLIVDSSWEHLRFARKLGIPTYRGDILSEQTEYSLDFAPYPVMIAATETDAYNALISSNFIPEIGREMLFQTAPYRADKEDYHPSLGGIVLFDEQADIYSLNSRIVRGHVIRKTTLTDKFTEDDYFKTRPDKSLLLYIKREDGSVQFWAPKRKLTLKAGDTLVSLAPPVKEMEKAQERISSMKNQ